MESKKIEPKLSRKKAADIILSFVNLIDLHFPSEEIFTKAIDIYKQTSLDITDTFLYLKAKEENQKLKTYDKKLSKLKL